MKRIYKPIGTTLNCQAIQPHTLYPWKLTTFNTPHSSLLSCPVKMLLCLYYRTFNLKFWLIYFHIYIFIEKFGENLHNHFSYVFCYHSFTIYYCNYTEIKILNRFFPRFLLDCRQMNSNKQNYSMYHLKKNSFRLWNFVLIV